MSSEVLPTPPSSGLPLSGDAGRRCACLVLGLMFACATCGTAAVSGGAYTVDPVTIDAGGQATSAGVYRHWAGGLGAIGSISSGGAYANRSGYVGQLPDHGVLHLATGSYNVTESDGTLQITVLRTGGSEGTVTTAYSFVGGLATPGVDFTPSAGTVTLGDGQTSAVITLAIIADGIREGTETTTLVLAPPSGGAVLTTPASATITITDDASAALADARPRIVSEATLWAVANQSWDYDVVVDPQLLQLAHALTVTYDFSFTLQNPPAGMTIVKTGPVTAHVTWPASVLGQHVRAVVRVRDNLSGTADQQETLIYVVAAPSAGG